MQTIIPNYGQINLKYLILDYNGTLAIDGRPIVSKDQITRLSHLYEIVVLSGNTFSGIKDHLDDYPLKVVVTPTGQDKADYIQSLGPTACIAIGNGNIDVPMLEAAGLSIAVIGQEGCASRAVLSSDILVTAIQDAFDIISNEDKLHAVLKG
jgi:soluble P-type ATPase